MLFQAAEHLQSFIADCDRRTELAKKRLAETQDEISAEVAAKVMSALFGLSDVLPRKATNSFSFYLFLFVFPAIKGRACPRVKRRDWEASG